MFFLLKRAADLKMPIQIIYIDKNNQITQRMIKVLAISDENIRAYCYMKRKFRTFKLSNILSVGFAKRGA